MKPLVLGAVAFCIALGLFIGLTDGLAYGAAITLLVALIVAVFVLAVWSGWKLLAALVALLALGIIGLPIACVGSIEAGVSEGETSCTSLAGLPPAIALPVMVVGAVTAWILVARP